MDGENGERRVVDHRRLQLSITILASTRRERGIQAPSVKNILPAGSCEWRVANAGETTNVTMYLDVRNDTRFSGLQR